MSENKQLTTAEKQKLKRDEARARIEAARQKLAKPQDAVQETPVTDEEVDREVALTDATETIGSEIQKATDEMAAEMTSTPSEISQALDRELLNLVGPGPAPAGDCGLRIAPFPQPTYEPAEGTFNNRVTFETWLRSKEGLDASDPRMPTNDGGRFASELDNRLRMAFNAGRAL